MHHIPTSALRRFGLIALTFCLLFSASSAVAIVAQQGDFVIIINPDAATFPLLESAASGNAVGIYNSGVVAFVLSAQNGMAEVRIGGAWDASDGVVGYVPEGYLSYADAGIPVSASLPVAEVQPVDGSGAALLRTTDLAPGVGEGLLPAGTQVEVLGELPDRYHVQFGVAVGFLPKEALRPIDKQAMFGYSVARDGFAIGRAPEDAGSGMWDAYVYAFPDEEQMVNGSMYFGESVSLINDLGEWTQIRTSYGTVGFVKSMYLETYLLDDMAVATPATYGAGSYSVGADLPAGLYTLEIPAGGSGSMEAIGQGNDAYHNYIADGFATFAMYLAQPMAVEITGQAILSPMDTDTLVSEDIGWQYSGSGRFFCGVQLRSHWVFSFEITLLPGESVGYIARTSLSAETGKTGPEERFYLTPGEVTNVTMTIGEFFELRNCVIVGMRGNG